LKEWSEKVFWSKVFLFFQQIGFILIFPANKHFCGGKNVDWNAIHGKFMTGFKELKAYLNEIL
jgi:hypothetical protein